MSRITTHVLDTAHGHPAAGVPVTLSGPDGAVIARGETDADGRIRDLGPETLPSGDYRLVFNTARYFKLIESDSFYPRVVVDFHVEEGDSHYHVPLLLSPFGYSTYRGS